MEKSLVEITEENIQTEIGKALKHLRGRHDQKLHGNRGLASITHPPEDRAKLNQKVYDDVKSKLVGSGRSWSGERRKYTWDYINWVTGGKSGASPDAKTYGGDVARAANHIRRAVEGHADIKALGAKREGGTKPPAPKPETPKPTASAPDWVGKAGTPHTPETLARIAGMEKWGGVTRLGENHYSLEMKGPHPRGLKSEIRAHQKEDGTFVGAYFENGKKIGADVEGNTLGIVSSIIYRRALEAHIAGGGKGKITPETPKPETPKPPAPSPAPTKPGAVAWGPSMATNFDTSGLPKTGALRSGIENTLKAMDEVHGDGTLKRIPIVRGGSAGAAASFYSEMTGEAIKIGVKSGDSINNSFAHETGHYIDAGILGRGKPWSLSNDHSSGSPAFNAARQKLWEALSNSPTFKKIVANSKSTPSKEFTMEEIHGPSAAGMTGKTTMSANAAYLRYMARPKEVIARSYAQYIAVRSKNPAMMAEVKAYQDRTKTPDLKGWINSQSPMVWEDDEFGPIADAFDAVFESVGWRK